MKFKFEHNGAQYTYDSEKLFDLSTPIRDGNQNVNAYYLAHPSFKAFRMGTFVGSTNEGGPCNCFDISFNPHGNGTHTECVGHISKETYTINECLKDFTSIARLITVSPETLENGDQILPATAISELDFGTFDTLIIRTMPNDDSKLLRQYSGTNPTYLSHELTALLAKNGIRHLIIDLPSVDREEDGGKLLAHHAFWQYPEAPRMNATITELAYIPDHVSDGTYLLQLHIASFESDASPSKPVIYPIQEA